MSVNIQLNQIFTVVNFIFLCRRTPFNYLLLNLAVADIVYPTSLFAYFTYHHSLNNPDGMPENAICLSLKKLAWIGEGCSILTLIAIARERYWAVVHPLSIQRKLTWRRAYTVYTCKRLAVVYIRRFFLTNFIIILFPPIPVS